LIHRRNTSKETTIILRNDQVMNQQLVVYAPGYAAPGPVLNFHDLTLGGVNLPALVGATVTVKAPQRTFMTGEAQRPGAAARHTLRPLHLQRERAAHGLRADGAVTVASGAEERPRMSREKAEGKREKASPFCLIPSPF
jgi:hypothetical protein